MTDTPPPSADRPTTRRRAGWPALLLAVFALLVTGCSGTAAPEAGPSAPSSDGDGCITDFDPGTDYYDNKQQIRHAENFSISYHRSYQVITVEQPEPGAEPESYVLRRCGAPEPELSGELADAPQLTTPVDSLFSASTTHIPSLEALDRLDALTGVAAKAFITSEAARARVASEDVTEFAPGGTADAEKIVAADPDVVITGGFADPGYASVERAGIPVLANAEFLETSALGQAEWIKFFAALTGTEQQAAETFDQIESDYRAAVQQVADTDPVPVLLNQPVQGAWAVPTGASTTGALITDAGGSWPWRSASGSGTKNTDLETVLSRSADAEVWITSTNWTTRKEATQSEPRLAEFDAFDQGEVWAPSLQVNESGGNNYYELGALRADLVVADLIAILHPDALPDHEFTFYQQLD